MKKLATFLGAGILLVLAPLAQGALQISHYNPATSTNVVCGSGGDTGPVTCFAAPTNVGTVTVTNTTATSTSPGSTSFPFSRIFESTTTISSASGGTFEFWIAAQNFNIPNTPPDVFFRSNLATTTTSGSGTANLTSCVDTGNDLAPPTDTFCSPGISLTNPALPYASGSDSNTITSLISSLTGTFSLSQHITISLDPGTEVNLVTSAVLTQVPEPTSVALFGGVLLMTGAALRKKFARR